MDIKITLTVKGGDNPEKGQRIAIARLIGWFSADELEDGQNNPLPGALLVWNVEQPTVTPVVVPPPSGGRR